ncbi:MAG: ATP-binding protein [Candidatus Rokuibacteriota bacterium]
MTLEAFLRIEARVLELVAAGEPLPAALDQLARAFEERATGMLVSILLLDAGGGLRHAAAPSLPEAYTHALDAALGGGVGASGAAAFPARSDVVTDIAHDPLWAAHRELALRHGLRACWSTPILGLARRVLGTLTVCYREPRSPTVEELALIDSGVHIARIAIEHHHALQERDRLRAREQEAQREAGAASAGTDLFLATLSHELRTPLTAILGWTRLLRIGAAPPSALPHALEVIERNTRLQERLVNDLLDVSRIVAGTLRIEPLPVDLGAVVEAAVESLRAAAGARGVTVERALDAGAGPVLGDAARLQQIVGNLLSNAVKFAPEGGRVAVALAREDDHAVVRVGDSGPGIDPAVLLHVFDRFRRGGEPPGTGHGGLGLGLAIARHLVDLHGGALEAEPTGPLGGALFTVRLPCRSREVPPLAGAEGRDAMLPSLEGTRVLVVEDEADTRALLTAALERSGGTVAAASGADEALAVLEAFRPDVLVSDLRMPGKDGYALIREVRARDARHGGRLPALAVTAYAGPDEAEHARDAGFDRYVTKPLEPAALVRAIVAALDGA